MKSYKGVYVSSGRSGGSGGGEGYGFQADVGAWYSVKILAEKYADPALNLPTDTILKKLHGEIHKAKVDDLVVETNQGAIYIQAKRTVRIDEDSDSKFYSAIQQFVKQFISGNSVGKRVGELLSEQSDKLVLIVSQDAPSTVTNDLKRILVEIRAKSTDISIKDVLDSLSKKDKKHLEKLVSCIESIYRNEKESNIVPSDLISILRLIYIMPLSIENNGSHLTAAKELLKSSVLADPTDSNLVWTVLQQQCFNNLIINKGNVDINVLHNWLSDFQLLASPNYRKDIEYLKKLTERTLLHTRHFCYLSLGNEEIVIKREATSVLQNLVSFGSTVIVGDAGVGKSGLLHNFAQTKQQGGFDVLFLTTEDLDEFDRLDHPIEEVLKGWIGKEPGYLIIDGLDAARENASKKKLLRLAKTVTTQKGRWSIVASIRQFDLKHSSAWQAIFKKSSDFSVDTTHITKQEFLLLNHLFVPELNDQDLDDLRSASEQLEKVLSNPTVSFRMLIANLFNLQLICGLIDLNVENLDAIETETQLLDTYWNKRVIQDDGHGLARVTELKKICKHMGKQRNLFISESKLDLESASNERLDELLRSNVVKKDGYNIRFSHHRIFDYAFQRLILRDDFVSSLSDYNESPLFILPSISLYFEYLWVSDSKQFWKQSFSLVDNDVRNIVQIIPMRVVARYARKINDLEPLSHRLQKGDSSATKQFRYLITNVLVEGTAGSVLWFKYVSELATALTPSNVSIVYAFFIRIFSYANSSDEEPQRIANEAACKLIDFCLGEVGFDYMLSRLITILIESYDVSPDVSENYLHEFLETESFSKYGYTILSTLAAEIDRLSIVMPNFVKDVYIAAFDYNEISSDPVYAGGPLLTLKSDKRQNYYSAKYALEEKFSQFLAISPRQAIPTLFQVVREYVLREKNYSDSFGFFTQSPDTNAISKPFDRFNKFDITVNGESHLLISDLSYIWDKTDSHETGEFKLLHLFVDFLTTIDSSTETQIEEIIALIAQEQLSILWRQLFRAVQKAPDKFYSHIKPLLFERAFYECLDTRDFISDILNISMVKLKSNEISSSEQLIFSLYESSKVNQRNVLELLAPFSRPFLNRNIEEFVVNWELNNSVPDFETQIDQDEVVNAIEIQSDSEIPLDKRIEELTMSISEFFETQGDNLNTELFVKVISYLNSVYELLLTPSLGISESVTSSWRILSKLCCQIATKENLNSNKNILNLCQKVLVDASRNPDPVINQSDTSWVLSSGVRVHAAEGLMKLIRNPDYASEVVLKAIRNLSRDKSHKVRYEIISRFDQIDDFCRTALQDNFMDTHKFETSTANLEVLCHQTMQYKDINASKKYELLAKIYKRYSGKNNARKLRRKCIDSIVTLYLNENVETSILSELINNPDINVDDAYYLAFRRNEISIGLNEHTNAIERRKAFELLKELALSIKTRVDQYHNDGDFGGSTTNEFGNIVKIGDSIAHTIAFTPTSDLNPEKGKIKFSAKESLNTYLDESEEILKILPSIISAPSVNYLVKMLNSFFDLEPKRIVLAISDLLTNSQRSGYHTDPDAIKSIVKLIEKCLDMHHDFLIEDPEVQKSILDILDMFIEMDIAIQLAYRLEDIYR